MAIILPVFRELLQNSDDAGSKSVEIHFETQAYLNRRKEVNGVEGEASSIAAKGIPDLRKEPACFEVVVVLDSTYLWLPARFINGRSRTTAWCFVMKIGIA